MERLRAVVLGGLVLGLRKGLRVRLGRLFASGVLPLLPLLPLFPVTLKNP